MQELSKPNLNESDLNDSKVNKLSDVAVWFSFPRSQWFISNTSNSNYVNGVDKWFFDKNKFTKSLDNIDFANENVKLNFVIQKPAKNDLINLEVLCTDDSEVLQSYYKLRGSEYRNYWGFQDYSDEESDFDRKGEIVIVMYNKKVIGGGRFMFPSVGTLSNEHPEENFTYKNIAKVAGIQLSDNNYVELSGLVLHSDFRDGKTIALVYKILIEILRKRGIKYMFGVTGIIPSRSYRIIFSTIGIYSKIIKSIMAPLSPQYNNLEMFPMIAFL
jgi:hypothetical protein